MAGEQAWIAHLNEFGTRTSPARPFVGLGCRAAVAAALGVLRCGVVNGVVTDKAAAAVGAVAAEHIKAAIRDLRTPPNAPRTVARKGGSNPLIATGDMRDAVGYAVES